VSSMLSPLMREESCISRLTTFSAEFAWRPAQTTRVCALRGSVKQGWATRDTPASVFARRWVRAQRAAQKSVPCLRQALDLSAREQVLQGQKMAQSPRRARPTIHGAAPAMGLVPQTFLRVAGDPHHAAALRAGGM